MNKSFFRCSKHRDRGFALLIVLGAIVLLLVLILGFFLRVQTDLQSSSTFQSAESTRNLADYAVNLVEAQIRAGTSGQDASGNVLAWASQPGAIRTYDTSGNLVDVYKLYSCNATFSQTGMVTDKITISDEAAALQNWTANRAFFTDLNEPLNGQFPILDPSALNAVKGFDVSGSGTPAASTYNPLVPMPGAWLYILRDGKVVSPTGAGSSATVGGATPDNPIVGRIAFWTDDESCKINLNTAGGGPWNEPNVTVPYLYQSGVPGNYNNKSGFSSFWSLPIAADSTQDCAMALNQPVPREYQRYPGHPANTYLTAAFPEITNMDDLYGTATHPGILPRLQNEGSQGGSIATSSAVNLDTDRLYASTDETLFLPTRIASSSVDAAVAKRSAFFVTTAARSPDVNLFNEPRIGIWPITRSSPTDVSKMTAYDKLIAFCETINQVPYYFCRMDPDSATTDLSLVNNQNILAYLRGEVIKPVPGFGGPSGILGKYPGEADQITTEIFDYIRSTNTRDTSMNLSGSQQYKYAYTSKTASTAPTGAVVPIQDGSTRGLGRYPTLTKVGIIFFGVAINRTGTPQSTDRYKPGFKIGPPETESDPATVPQVGKLKMRAMLVFEMFNPGAGYSLVYPQMTMEVTAKNFTWHGGNPMFASNSGIFSYTSAASSWTGSRVSSTGLGGGRISCLDVAAPFNDGSPNFSSTKYPFLGAAANDSPEVDIGGVFTFDGGQLDVDIKDADGETVQQFTNISFPAATLPVPDIAPKAPDASVDLRVPTMRLRFGTPGSASAAEASALLSEVDTVRSISVPADFRLTAATKNVDGALFKGVTGRYNDSARRLAHNLFLSTYAAHLGAALGSYGGPTVKSAQTTQTQSPTVSEQQEGDFDTALYNGYYTTNGPVSEAAWKLGVTTTGLRRTYLADIDSLGGAKIQGPNILGDWDNATGLLPDGPYVNFPDEINPPTGGSVPYFGQNSNNTSVNLVAPYFTPNRIMPSAVMLGSLPTGVKEGFPWQTLLFRPSKAGHPGLGTPPDYLLLDLFSMPIVEPYAISEPLSTAGRVNMNYQILPYTYITRSTGVQAVLRSEQMMALSNATDANAFKERQASTDKIRWKLDLSDTTGTLKGFKDRFDSGDIFRSASEICSIWLVPDKADGAPGNPTYDTMATWWDGFIPTGDNTKESSYARIYPRLTTKSNTFTVHYRVQALKKQNSAAPGVWVEDKDKVVAEYRGSTTIERYVDPNDPSIPDYTTGSGQKPLGSFYKFRLLSQKQFNP